MTKNPFLIARHGPRPQMGHYLLETGIEDVKVLGEKVRSLVSDYDKMYLCYGDTEYGTFGANKQTAEVIGEQLGIEAVKEPVLAVNMADIGRGGVSKDKLEYMDFLIGEKLAQYPVMCITNDTIIKGLAPYVVEKYNFDVNLYVEFISFASGWMFDFEENDVLSLPGGYSMKRAE